MLGFVLSNGSLASRAVGRGPLVTTLSHSLTASCCQQELLAILVVILLVGAKKRLVDTLLHAINEADCFSAVMVVCAAFIAQHIGVIITAALW